MLIPNVVHFAFTSPADGTGVPFSFIHYLAVASAARFAEPDRLVLHTLHDQEGPWWDRAARLADVQYASVPETTFNCRFEHPAHRADAIRLDTLYREGGIFLDLDVISLRPYRPLLDMPAAAVVGWEDGLAVCPAVVLARPGASFIRRWIEGYDPERSQWRGFRSRGWDEYWGEMSTKYPKHLARQHPESVALVPPHYFYPVHWRRASCERLFFPPEAGGVRPDELDGSYAVHLWETGSWSRGLSDLDPESVLRGSTTMQRVLAPLLEPATPDLGR